MDPYAVLDAPPIVLRSTWDYHRVPTLFQAWLESLGRIPAERYGTTRPSRAATSTKSISDNSRRTVSPFPKRDGSIASTTTPSLKPSWLRAGRGGVQAANRGHGVRHVPRLAWRPVVAGRPRSGAIVRRPAPGIHLRDRRVRRDLPGVLRWRVQPRRLQAGEPGDFRVQQDFGGSVVPFAPSPELLAFAERVISQVNGPTLYARVDVVETDRGPLLMELELIERSCTSCTSPPPPRRSPTQSSTTCSLHHRRVARAGVSRSELSTEPTQVFRPTNGAEAKPGAV